MQIVDPSGNPINSRTTGAEYAKMAAIIQRELKGTSAVSQPFGQNVWVYSCVSEIASDFSQIPLGLWRRGSGGSRNNRTKGWRQVDEDPVLELMDNPNELMDQEQFLETWATYLLTGGNVWIHILDRTSRALPTRLLLWGVAHVRPYNGKSGGLEAWELSLGNGKKTLIPLEDMIHTRLPNPYSSYLGLPPVASLSLQLDADHARTVFDAAFFRNNASPDAVLVHKDGALGPSQREQVLASWNEFHQGADKAGGVAVIGGNWDFKIWGMEHSKTQFIENRSFTREEVASVFHFPVTLLNSGQNSGLTREAITAATRSKYDRAVFPLCARFKGAFNRRIVKPKDPRMLMDFEIEQLPIMTNYLQEKAEVLNLLVKNGVPVNQAIERLNFGFDPVEGGDKGYLPGNYVPMDALQDVDLMAPPVATPADRPSAPDRSNFNTGDAIEVNSGSGIILDKLSTRIKRVLFQMRVEALRDFDCGEDLDLESSSKVLYKQMLPTCMAVAVLGEERSSGKSGWISRVSGLNKSQVDEFFSLLQVRGEFLSEKREYLVGPVGKIVRNEIERLLLPIRTDIENGLDIKEAFSSIHRMAKDSAKRLLDSCESAGQVRNSEGVFLTHE